MASRTGDGAQRAKLEVRTQRDRPDNGEQGFSPHRGGQIVEISLSYCSVPAGRQAQTEFSCKGGEEIYQVEEHYKRGAF